MSCTILLSTTKIAYTDRPGKAAMPVSSKKAQVTTSAPTVNTAQPRIRPAKRAKKSMVNPEVKVNDAEWHFPIFYRSLSNDDPATKETEETVDDGPEKVNECKQQCYQCAARLGAVTVTMLDSRL